MLVVASASKPRWANSRAVPTSHGLGMMNAPSRSCSARKARPFSAWVSISLPRIHAEGPFDNFDEVSLLPQDKLLVLCHGEVLNCLRICFQTSSVSLIRGEAVECD